MICELLVENPENTDHWYDTKDELLKYTIDNMRLRDIITEVKVTERTL